MAREPDKKTAAPAEDLAKDAVARLAEARQQKAIFSSRIEECYYFAAPSRIREQQSTTTSENKPEDADELQTSLGIEVAEDFMTMLIDSFMPQAGRWAERLADPFTHPARKKVIEAQARQEDESIFQMIRASNFHAELAKQGVPDAAIGVLAMQIDDTAPHKPVRCIGIPIRELEINLGPDGRIDDRFIVRRKKYRHLKALLPEVKSWPAEIEKKIKEKPDEKVEVAWGYWRKWDVTDDEAWQHVVLVDKKTVHKAELKGEGCCPLVVGRMGALSEFAWPEGPMIRALPDLRMIDETDAAFIENIDFTIRPPIAYPDDGVMSFEDGIEPGMAYPRRPGATANDLQKIYEPNPLEAAIFQHEERKRRVRRLHYVDFPEQKGKTPPTLGQWLDEMVEAQKKIGTPGYAFWREFPYEAFQRFRYIGEKRGGVKPIRVEGPNGRKMTASLQAYNPAQRAQENQEVLVASRLLQIVASIFPQTIQVAVDDLTTIRNIQEKLGDKLVRIRTQAELQEAVGTVAQLVGVGGPRLPGGIAGAAGGQ